MMEATTMEEDGGCPRRHRMDVYSSLSASMVSSGFEHNIQVEGDMLKDAGVQRVESGKEESGNSTEKISDKEGADEAKNSGKNSEKTSPERGGKSPEKGAQSDDKIPEELSASMQERGQSSFSVDPDHGEQPFQETSDDNAVTGDYDILTREEVEEAEKAIKQFIILPVMDITNKSLEVVRRCLDKLDRKWMDAMTRQGAPGSKKLILMPCVTTTRLGTDIARTTGKHQLPKKEGNEDRLLVVFQHRARHNSHLTPSKAIIPSLLNDFDNVVDIVFTVDEGIYDSPHNKRAMHSMQAFVEKQEASRAAKESHATKNIKYWSSFATWLSWLSGLFCSPPKTISYQ